MSHTLLVAVRMLIPPAGIELLERLQMNIKEFNAINAKTATRQKLLEALRWNDPNGDYDELATEALRYLLRDQQGMSPGTNG